MRATVGRFDMFSDFEYHTTATQKPWNIQYHTLDTLQRILLVRETTNHDTLRLSAWNYDGDLLWSRNTNHPISETIGPLLLSASGKFVMRTTKDDHIYDTRTGTLVWTVSERILDDVANGQAYIVLRRSNTLEGLAALDLLSSSLNEHISLADSLQFKNTVVVSKRAIHFRSDSSWIVMINPSAVVSEESTFYSEILHMGTVTHVTLNQDELQILSAGNDDQKADIHIYDLQGRLLSTINGITLGAGITHVLTSISPLPRYALVQIMSNDKLLYQGTVVQ